MSYEIERLSTARHRDGISKRVRTISTHETTLRVEVERHPKRPDEVRLHADGGIRLDRSDARHLAGLLLAFADEVDSPAPAPIPGTPDREADVSDHDERPSGSPSTRRAASSEWMHA